MNIASQSAPARTLITARPPPHGGAHQKSAMHHSSRAHTVPAVAEKQQGVPDGTPLWQNRYTPDGVAAYCNCCCKRANIGRLTLAGSAWPFLVQHQRWLLLSFHRFHPNLIVATRQRRLCQAGLSLLRQNNRLDQKPPDSSLFVHFGLCRTNVVHALRTVTIGHQQTNAIQRQASTTPGTIKGIVHQHGFALHAGALRLVGIRFLGRQLDLSSEMPMRIAKRPSISASSSGSAGRGCHMVSALH